MAQDAAGMSVGSGSGPPTLDLRIDWQLVGLLAIVVALVLTRGWDLGNRSYSHDEAIHAWEAWKLVSGQRYVHDPVYHGPFLYHVTALVYFFLGVSDVTARVGAALFAIGVVLMVWPLRAWIGRAGALFAMALLTMSPTLMFRGRFIRHDIFVMLPSMVMLLCFFRYLEDRQERWLYILASALSLGFCAKANAFINGAIFGSFWLLYLVAQWARTRRRMQEYAVFDVVMLMATLALPLLAPVVVKALGFNPLDYTQAGMLRTLSVVLVLFSLSAFVGTWWNQRVWLVSAGIYYTIYILLYTTLFSNARGAATGFVGMLGYWLSQQNVARGGQPWYYYFMLLSVYEFLPLLLSLLGGAYYLWARRSVLKSRQTSEEIPALETPVREAFVPLLLYWVLMNAVIFTWSSEKMSWQNMHLTLPLGLLGGWFLGAVWDKTDWRDLAKRGAGYAALLLPVVLLSLLVLLRSMIGEPGPFAGMALEQLYVSLRWLLSAGVLGAAAFMLWRFARRLNWQGWSRIGLAFVVLILGALTLRVALRLSFANQDYATEFLVYAAATPDTGLVMRELEEMSMRLAGDKELKIAYDDESSWPFVWYLRDYKNASYFTAGTGLTGDPDVVLIGPGNESKIKSQLAGKYLSRGYRLIWWPNQDVYSNLTPGSLWRDLRDPVRRTFWWDILWSRKYPQSTTSWPYVQRFAMYVRKDSAAKLWDYGPEVAGGGVQLPEDEYEKKRVQIAATSSWGSYGSAAGQLNYPKDLAVDGQGNVYVADSYNHRVQVFNAQGQFLREWGAQGTGPGQFQEPWGIAVDDQGSVYVADTWNHRIQKFDLQGQFVRQWGFFGDTSGALDDPLMMYGPRDVAIGVDGNILVSDTGNKRILSFTSEGEFVRQWGGGGSLDGQLREPVGLAVDDGGHIYVADTWNRRVQMFDPQGVLVRQWPVLGWEGEGVSNKPYLAVDGQGNVYATAPDYNRVVKFDPSGAVVALWGQYGSDLASLNMPSGIEVDADGSVLVLDSSNHRVMRFSGIP
jgi:uncharacterized protein (TIGR03663 family)